MLREVLEEKVRGTKATRKACVVDAKRKVAAAATRMVSNEWTARRALWERRELRGFSGGTSVFNFAPKKVLKYLSRVGVQKPLETPRQLNVLGR